METEEIIIRIENTIINLIKQLDTCSDAEVPFIHNRIRRAQKLKKRLAD